ncbi:MAG TPA: tetratricopeptide repeat protein [Thermoanaerobaculia bacterium]|nr:tetratricopeptide repeat protein [Thermoanaerobaculia bacterium]
MLEKKASALSALTLCGTLLALLGCASHGPIVGDLDKALRTRGLDPASVVIPFEITDEIRAWAHQQIPKNTPVEERLDLLLAGLLGPDRLHIQYEARSTGTAVEVFQNHRANCLAFTSLFVALGREVGVPVVYLAVDDIERFEKEGDLVVVSGHVSAGFNTGHSLKILDFSLAPPAAYRSVNPISDLRAIALYHSNRGAEALRASRTEDALVWLRKAVAIDPELGGAWINYGVALRRSGDAKGAEAAYRKALEVDPNAASAYQNLAALLRLQGQEKEADDLLTVSTKLGSRNPFIYLTLGDLSFSHGRLDEARRFYRRALRLYRQSAEPYAAMGLISLAQGDTGDAERWLKKALAIDQENQRVKQLAYRLGGRRSA